MSRSTEYGSFYGKTRTRALAQALQASQGGEAGSVWQYLVFRQGAEWVATATRYGPEYREVPTT
jgi:hypothetical protein